jgi:hypothetical protein
MPLYEQRHYVDHAAWLNTWGRMKLPPEHWVKICLSSAERFREDNPKFKPVLFLQACGMTEGQALLLKG